MLFDMDVQVLSLFSSNFGAWLSTKYKHTMRGYRTCSMCSILFQRIAVNNRTKITLSRQAGCTYIFVSHAWQELQPIVRLAIKALLRLLLLLLWC